VKEYTQGKGVEVILDPILVSNYSFNLKSLALDGRWAVYGSMGGNVFENLEFK